MSVYSAERPYTAVHSPRAAVFCVYVWVLACGATCLLTDQWQSWTERVGFPACAVDV